MSQHIVGAMPIAQLEKNKIKAGYKKNIEHDMYSWVPLEFSWKLHFVPPGISIKNAKLTHLFIHFFSSA